jgi:hypothetical protein
MEREIRENDYVIIVCTPQYREKSDARKGGVGYEGDIMTAEVHTQGNHRKFIPVLARGEWKHSAPSWLKGKYYIDLSCEAHFGRNYSDLTATILGRRAAAPPVAKPSSLSPVRSSMSAASPREPVRILGVVVDEVTEPTLDGTPGSALYTVPFQLSRQPSRVWEQVFVNTWNSPPRYTSMHRPGIASVSGSKIVLAGTTIEEVKAHHRDTLVLSVEKANEEEATIYEKARLDEERKRQRAEEHRKSVRDGANDIAFD